MTDKELRRLKRAELLEILFYLQKEIDNLKQQNQELQTRIENLAINKQSLSDEDLKRIEEIVKKTVNPSKETLPLEEPSGDNQSLCENGNSEDETERYNNGI